jgi:serine/threonine-protein kinase RsbT
MIVIRSEALQLQTSGDVLQVRQKVRAWRMDLGFGLVDLTKMVTAASELGRNTVVYGGGGSARLAALEDGARTGLQLVFEDQGPGIPDIELTLKDGHSTGGGLGLGLGGSRRLVNRGWASSAPDGSWIVATSRPSPVRALRYSSARRFRRPPWSRRPSCGVLRMRWPPPVPNHRSRKCARRTRSCWPP